MPGRKPTAAEIAERVDQAITLLCRGKRQAEVVSELRTDYGVSKRTAARYVARAREEMLEESGIDRKQLIAEMHLRYLEIYRTSENGHTRVRALDGIVRLFGLVGSTPVEISGKVSVDLNSKNRQKLLEDDVFMEIQYRACQVLAGYNNGEPNGEQAA